MRILRKDLDPFGLVQRRGLQLSRRELDILQKASQIAFEAREALRREGVDEGHGVDDLLELDGFVDLDLIEAGTVNISEA